MSLLTPMPAYTLQTFLSKRVVVNGHCCHTVLHFGVKAKENKTKFLRFTGFLNSIKTYKARYIANSSSCTTTELSKLLTSCLIAVKILLLSILVGYMRDPVKTYFGLLKMDVKF